VAFFAELAEAITKLVAKYTMNPAAALGPV